VRFEHAGSDVDRLSIEDAFAPANDFDLFDVVTPTDTHSPIALRALAAGGHVLVEKPLARTAAQGRELERAAIAANRHVAVVSQYRWVPAFRILKDRIQDLAPGRATARLVQTPGMAGTSDPKSWKRDPLRAGGAVLMGTAVHLLDLVLWLLGPADVTSARMERAVDGFETRARIAGHAGRCAIEFEAAIRADVLPEMTLELETRRGRIAVIDRRLHGAPIAWKAAELRAGLAARLAPARREPLARQMIDLVAALETRISPEPRLSEAIAVLELVEAAYRSAGGSDRI
jgi:predicted dehydrogenase